MAATTKTVINCSDPSLDAVKGISIVIDQQQEMLPATVVSSAANIIKIQHTTSTIMPATIYSSSTSSSTASAAEAMTLPNENKTSIDINRNNNNNSNNNNGNATKTTTTTSSINKNNTGGSITTTTTTTITTMELPQSTATLLQSNAAIPTTLSAAETAEYMTSPADMDNNGMAVKKNALQIQCNGQQQNAMKNLEYNNNMNTNNKQKHKYDKDADNHKQNHNDNNIAYNNNKAESEKCSKEFSLIAKYHKESGQTSQQVNKTVEAEEEKQKTCLKANGQHVDDDDKNNEHTRQRNNENNSSFSINNNIQSSATTTDIVEKVNNHYTSKHNDDVAVANNEHGVSTSNIAGIGKRDCFLMEDFSHGGKRRSLDKENSNSLITKADPITASSSNNNNNSKASSSSSTVLTINNNNNNNNKNNLQINDFSAQKEQNPNENSAHVVKIQIKPKENSIESKQISVVKIENITKTPEEEEEKEFENQNLSAEILKSDLNLNFDKMVQKSAMINVTQHPKHISMNASNGNGTVTITNSNGGGGIVGGNNGGGSSTSVTELNVTNPNYLYYMMSSGQFSPCDTLDSGTGSDLEQNQQQSQSSPKIMSKDKKSTTAPLELHLKTTKLRLSNANTLKDNQMQLHQRQCLYTDSEESEASSLSCDSLHSNEFIRQTSSSPMEKLSNGNENNSSNTSSPSAVDNKKYMGSLLPDSLLRDIKNLKFNATDYEAENEEDDELQPADKQLPHQSKNSTQEYVMAQAEYVEKRNNHNMQAAAVLGSNKALSKRASLPSKTFVLNTEDGTFIDTKMNSMPRKYEADKYYNFHVNEHENFRSFGSSTNSLASGLMDDAMSLMSLSEYDSKSLHSEDAFAGYKDIRCGSNTSTIRSSKGTVRGVKNRVRNGIATFLQMQQPNIKNYKEKDLGKVVLYTTSMGIIRDTYAKCSNVKQILRTLLVKFEERDIFMSIEYQQEIKERMHSDIIRVPQLFVEGQHIGDADTVERLNESGELRQLLKPYKSIATIYTCQMCGGYRLLPCPSCNGSKKSVHRNHFTAEFVALKCMNCDEVGLVKCHNC